MIVYFSIIFLFLIFIIIILLFSNSKNNENEKRNNDKPEKPFYQIVAECPSQLLWDCYNQNRNNPEKEKLIRERILEVCKTQDFEKACEELSKECLESRYGFW